MNREKRINQLKKDINDQGILTQSMQKELEDIENLEDITMVKLWGALEGIKDIKAGYKSKSIKIKLESLKESEISCEITSNYHFEESKKEIINSYLKDRFKKPVKLTFKTQDHAETPKEKEN